MWDTTDSTYESVNIVAKRHNLATISRDAICKSFGCNKEESAHIYFPNMELSQSVNLIDEIAKINIFTLEQKGGFFYYNLKNTLKDLCDQSDLYIVSNTAEVEYIEAFLTSSRTHRYFKSYIVAGYIEMSKEEAIRKIVMEDNLERAVYIGDTIKDYNSAEKAKVPFIQAKYGFGEDLKTKYSINNLEELPYIIDKVFKDNYGI